jgi:hypothetical protein
MTAKLTRELADAVEASEERAVDAIGPDGNKEYTVVDRELHRQAMAALRQQEGCAAIAEGIRQMEAGEGSPVEEAEARSRPKHGFPPRQTA